MELEGFIDPSTGAVEDEFDAGMVEQEAENPLHVDDWIGLGFVRSDKDPNLTNCAGSCVGKEGVEKRLNTAEWERNRVLLEVDRQVLFSSQAAGSSDNEGMSKGCRWKKLVYLVAQFWEGC